jgi:hypothetical protein
MTFALRQVGKRVLTVTPPVNEELFMADTFNIREGKTFSFSYGSFSFKHVPLKWPGI